MPLPALVRALRPHQWSKNLFVLAAPVFAYGDQLVDVSGEDFFATFLTFVAFCMAASAVYLLNDVVDVERDRHHPTKKNRPIASGEVPIPAALFVCVVLAATSLAIGFAVGGSPVRVAWVLAGYMAMNVAYGLRLKHVVLLDAFCIATGFLLRVVAGGAASGAEISHWLLLCTLFLALFLGLEKRRAEIDLLGEGGASHRSTLGQYTVGFLDQMVTVLAACTILCYTMYTVDERTAAKFGENNHLVWSVPFVAFGVGRYMYLVQTGQGGGNPTRVFLGGDLLFLLNTVAWAGVIVAVVLNS
ncbi:MAG: decaprenyl-phosphate phosphoribosyltransferase [Planctomycetota bacterium]